MSATAETLIRDLSARGVRLSRNADRLHVEAPAGTLTPELRKTLAEAKPAILAMLTSGPTRERLLALADAETIDPDLIRKVPAEDVGNCAGLPDQTLRAYLRALRDTDLRERGRRPDDETTPALCTHCGPVWVAPEVAAVAPTVDGWPRVLGCLWCRLRQTIPRPQVHCGDCRHFLRDSINPDGGMGSCTGGHVSRPNESLPYPQAERRCGQFRPVGEYARGLKG